MCLWARSQGWVWVFVYGIIVVPFCVFANENDLYTSNTQGRLVGVFAGVAVLFVWLDDVHCDEVGLPSGR